MNEEKEAVDPIQNLVNMLDENQKEIAKMREQIIKITNVTRDSKEAFNKMAVEFNKIVDNRIEDEKKKTTIAIPKESAIALSSGFMNLIKDDLTRITSIAEQSIKLSSSRFSYAASEDLIQRMKYDIEPLNNATNLFIKTTENYNNKIKPIRLLQYITILLFSFLLGGLLLPYFTPNKYLWEFINNKDVCEQFGGVLVQQEFLSESKKTIHGCFFTDGEPV